MKEFLSQRHVPFVEKDVAVDHGAAMEMVQRTGQRGVPVTILGDEVLIGFDRTRLERILEQVSATAPVMLGASVADAGRIGRRRGAELARGAYVGEVKPGSLAARVGLRTGDIIVEVADRAIHTAQDLEAVLSTLRRREPAVLVYQRENQRKNQRKSLRFMP